MSLEDCLLFLDSEAAIRGRVVPILIPVAEILQTLPKMQYRYTLCIGRYSGSGFGKDFFIFFGTPLIRRPFNFCTLASQHSAGVTTKGCPVSLEVSPRKVTTHRHPHTHQSSLINPVTVLCCGVYQRGPPAPQPACLITLSMGNI